MDFYTLSNSQGSRTALNDHVIMELPLSDLIFLFGIRFRPPCSGMIIKRIAHGYSDSIYFYFRIKTTLERKNENKIYFFLDNFNNN